MRKLREKCPPACIHHLQEFVTRLWLCALILKCDHDVKIDWTGSSRSRRFVQPLQSKKHTPSLGWTFDRKNDSTFVTTQCGNVWIYLVKSTCLVKKQVKHMFAYVFCLQWCRCSGRSAPCQVCCKPNRKATDLKNAAFRELRESIKPYGGKFFVLLCCSKSWRIS